MLTCDVRNSRVCLERLGWVLGRNYRRKTEGVGEGARRESCALCRPTNSHRVARVAVIIPSSHMPGPFLHHPAEQLQQKDQQILLLLEEKEMIFRDMTECSTPLPEECSPTHSPRALFRSNTEEAVKGGPLMKSAINEGNLHSVLPLLSPPMWFIQHYFLL